MNIFISFLSGLIFSIGLSVSTMINPQKVTGFLDIFGDWDPSLMFVMAGAVLANIVIYPLILKKGKPMFEKEFFLPTKKDFDSKLVIGSLLFGAGWGMSGICPGPGLVNLPFLNIKIIAFVGSMVVGMLIYSNYPKFIKGK